MHMYAKMKMRVARTTVVHMLLLFERSVLSRCTGQSCMFGYFYPLSENQEREVMKFKRLQSTQTCERVLTFASEIGMKIGIIKIALMVWNEGF